MRTGQEEVLEVFTEQPSTNTENDVVPSGTVNLGIKISCVLSITISSRQ